MVFSVETFLASASLAEAAPKQYLGVGWQLHDHQRAAADAFELAVGLHPLQDRCVHSHKRVKRYTELCLAQFRCSARKHRAMSTHLPENTNWFI